MNLQSEACLSPRVDRARYTALWPALAHRSGHQRL